jgi:drug/metabolite transporter (DMT)-like permease
MQSNFLLLLTAMIWGFAFVAQRAGMEHVGPFAFNGIRFFLGALSLLPLILYFRKKDNTKFGPMILSIAVGVVLFLGASLQQIGMVYTTAGNAGFITGLYVVLVPLLGLVIKQRAHGGIWAGALLAVGGMYLLGVKGNLSIDYGDALVLSSAFFWALHVQLAGYCARRMDALHLAFVQYMVCAVLSLIVAFFNETTHLSSVRSALVPIVYGGLFSVGVAYTLQIIAQKRAHPAHAAIILSLESVFAALGGFLLLDETMSSRGAVGCMLMLAGMIISQIDMNGKKKRRA